MEMIDDVVSNSTNLTTTEPPSALAGKYQSISDFLLICLTNLIHFISDIMDIVDDIVANATNVTTTEAPLALGGKFNSLFSKFHVLKTC